MAKPTKNIPLKRVLCIADVPNWIFDRHITYLQRQLGDEFEILKAYRGQAFQEDEFDLIYPLEFMLVEPSNILNTNKYITGIRSFISWADWEFLSLVDLLSAKFRRVHTVSEELYNIFSPYIPQASYVTHGVDLELFTPEGQPDNVVGHLRLGWAGNRNTYIKGFWEYIHPLSKLPGVELKTCGFADYNLSLEQMPDFYNTIDALICVSSFEGSNNTLLEAAGMERAIITTRVGTVPEYLTNQDSALIVERDSAAITRAVIELRDNPELRLKLGKNARKSLIDKKWDWKYKAEDFRQFFRRALLDNNLAVDRNLNPIQPTVKEDQHLIHVLQTQNQLLREMHIGDAIQVFDLNEEKKRVEESLRSEIHALEGAIQEIRASETYRLMQKILSNRLSQGMIKIYRKFRD